MDEATHHDWRVAPAVVDTSIYVVGICKRCGLARNDLLARRGEGHLDLSGDCPAERPAQDPDRSPFSVIG